jgi:hypothetical protein
VNLGAIGLGERFWEFGHWGSPPNPQQGTAASPTPPPDAMVRQWNEFPAVAHGRARGVASASPRVNFLALRSRCFGLRGEAELECGRVAPCGGSVRGRTSSPDEGLGETPKDWISTALSVKAKHCPPSSPAFSSAPAQSCTYQLQRESG